jgi:integrase
MDAPAHIAEDSPTFADAWSLWLAYRSYGTRPLRASTLADYESIYRRHLAPAFAGLPLERFDGTVIARFTIAATGEGVSAKRLSNVLVPLRACLRWQHRMGALARDPCPWFDPPARAADERRILTPHQIETLLAELPTFWRPHVAFAAYVGTRAGEQRALAWDDIDLESRTVRIDKTLFRNHAQRSTKTGHDRTVPLPPHIVEMLTEWRDACPPGPLVFPDPRGHVWDLDTFRSRVFKPALARAGLPPGTRFHDLRHTAASLYLQSGATVREVMEIFGWRQMQTALRYLHTAEPLAHAAERVSAARATAVGRAASSPIAARDPPEPTPASNYNVRPPHNGTVSTKTRRSAISVLPSSAEKFSCSRTCTRYS